MGTGLLGIPFTMSAFRSDEETPDEYPSAKKTESRQANPAPIATPAPIAGATPLKPSLVIGGIVWSVVLIAGIAVLPNNPGAAAGAALLIAATLAGVLFARSGRGRAWARGWDERSKRAKGKVVESGGQSVDGRHAVTLLTRGAGRAPGELPESRPRRKPRPPA